MISINTYFTLKPLTNPHYFFVLIGIPLLTTLPRHLCTLKLYVKTDKNIQKTLKVIIYKVFIH